MQLRCVSSYELVNAYNSSKTKVFAHVLEHRCELKKFVLESEGEPLRESSFHRLQDRVRNSTKTCFEHKLIFCGCTTRKRSLVWKKLYCLVDSLCHTHQVIIKLVIRVKVGICHWKLCLGRRQRLLFKRSSTKLLNRLFRELFRENVFENLLWAQHCRTTLRLHFFMCLMAERIVLILHLVHFIFCIEILWSVVRFLIFYLAWPLLVS